MRVTNDYPWDYWVWPLFGAWEAQFDPRSWLLGVSWSWSGFWSFDLGPFSLVRQDDLCE